MEKNIKYRYLNRIIKYVVAMTAFFISIMAVANTGHVIVAFDRAIPGYESTYRNVRTLNFIDEFIRKEFQYDHLYLSVVGYAMNGTYPDIDDFVVLYTDRDSRPVLWQNYNSLRDVFPYWPMGEPTQMNNYDRPGSMQSLAKPYCVMETVVKGKKQVADATFIIFVTDEEVQGIDDDYTGEWRNMSCYNKDSYAKIRDSVFEKLQQFNEVYRFELRKRIPIKVRKRIPQNNEQGNEDVNKFVLASYELLPAVHPSIYSVSDLPSPLPIKRVRGGFTLACQVESHNPFYEVEDWALYNTSGGLFKRNADDKVFIKSNELKDGDTLEIRMILRLSDNLYGGFLLSRRNCAGMALKQVVKLQDEAKVLGIVPLSDSFWWWFPDDVTTAVIIWDLLILLSLIGITVFVFYMVFVVINSYHPQNKYIKLTKI